MADMVKKEDGRNGFSSKTVLRGMGEVKLSIPRDRKGGFEPEPVKKRQTDIFFDTLPFRLILQIMVQPILQLSGLCFCLLPFFSPLIPHLPR